MGERVSGRHIIRDDIPNVQMFRLIRHSLCQNRKSSSLALDAKNVKLQGQTFPRDEWTNVSSNVVDKMSKGLHKQPGHPIHTIRSIIESRLQEAQRGLFTTFDSFSPIVSSKNNFDDLLIPKEHPGRQPSDTYYINQSTLLRTHTSAHQTQVLNQGNRNFLVTADVYRRDAVDKSHYPIFHQMEGVRTFKGPIPTFPHSLSSSITVHDDTVFGSKDPHADNALQAAHDAQQAKLVGLHLKHTLTDMVRSLFYMEKQLQVRWIDAYFPFTSPSWEMEILHQGEWLEVLGCGVMRQEILDGCHMSDHMGWAFGLGLERLAMVLFDVPDIRLFWSDDARFLSQFKPGKISKFKQFSKYPACYKDISFWFPETFHENDFCELVRGIAGDLAESVTMIDEFEHPKTKRRSRAYRINYQSMDRNVTNEEIDALQAIVVERAQSTMNVQVR